MGKEMIAEKKEALARLPWSSAKSAAESTIDQAEDLVGVASKVDTTRRELSNAKATLDATADKVKTLPDGAEKDMRNKAVSETSAKLDKTLKLTETHFQEALSDVISATRTMVEKVDAAEAGVEDFKPKLSEHHGKLVNAVQVAPF